jgi:putative ATP-binding cassette transporter
MTRLKLDNSRRFIGKVWSLTYPYWQSEERGRAWGLLVTIIALTLGLVYIDVQFNTWNREFYNALEQKNYADFKDLILYFAFLAVVFIAAAIYKLYLTQMLTMRWRAWLTKHYIADWMDRQVYYRLELDRRGTDNPDQRIAEDLKLFTDGTLSLSLGLLSSVVTLVSFITILWAASGPITLFGYTIAGYMVWAALIYAVAGSIFTHYVGRPLIGLNFQQERYEADFRFTLVRLRENAEGVALYRGEAPEREGLLTRFERIRANWWELMRFTKRLTGFTAGYSQIAIIFPFIVAAPRYFTGAMPLGGLMQIASAFGQVQGALSWFVQSYGTLANWRASVDRLLTFHAALDATVHEAEAAPAIPQVRDNEPSMRADGLALAVPGSEGGPARTLLADASFAIAPGERLLITGPSGSGKSTIFRALAGIWPFGRGTIRVPANARVLFLPQKPYIPIGTLRDAVSFPAAAGAFGDEALREVLRDCRLDRFTERLDETQNWSMLMSGGEQQRLAVARALLHKPDFLFLDEATASMDEVLERAMYELLVERLPDTAITSIAHNPEVAAFHARTLRMQTGSEGVVRLQPS